MKAGYEIIEVHVLPKVREGQSVVTVVSVTHNSLIGQHVHLWNNYRQGKKPTSGSWLVESHYLINKRMDEMLITNELVELHYPYNNDYGVRLTIFLRSQICTENEYLAWQASLNSV